jgi:hypothetical protein
VPVEVDTIPLHLLDLDPPAPRALGELVLGRQELLNRFATWLFALQPDLWKEIQHMASSTTTGSILNWEAIGKQVDLMEVVPHLPLDKVIERLGVHRAIEVIGLPRVIEAVGLPRVIETIGAEKVLDALLAQMPPERLQEMLQQRQQKA